MTNIAHERISNLPADQRPRERLAARGVSTLSDIELLSLLLVSGGRRRGVGQMAADLLDVLDTAESIPTMDEMAVVDGIGPARASLISAALEFSRRRIRPSQRRIREPRDVLPLVGHWADRPQEHFLVLSLNGAHEVLRIRVVSRGTIDRTLVHPREVFVDPLADRAAAIVAAHNHPSGSLDPSSEDKQLTARLKAAGELLGISLLDHVIFTGEGYYSFLESGTL